MADALEILSQAGVVEAITFVGGRCAGFLGTRGKVFDRVELLQDQTELILFLSGGGVDAAMDDGQ
ncbi:hypothetical protein D3C85_1532230 [compost metagenome]